MKTKFNYNNWSLELKKNSITISNKDEIRIYDIKGEVKNTKQTDECIYLYFDDESYYYIKFENDNFLVIDEYNNNDDFIDTIGAYEFNQN